MSARLTPHMCEAAGVAARVQGMRRYYALVLYKGGSVRLIKELQGTQVLGEASLGWEFGQSYDLKLEVRGNRLKGWVGEECLFDITDSSDVLASGAAALLCREGRTACSSVSVGP